MNRAIRLAQIAGVSLLASCHGSGREAATAFDADQGLPMERIALFGTGGVEGPSGIVYHPSRGTLFVVGDEGDLIEMTTDGVILRRSRLEGAPDLEGLTYAAPSGLLYAAVEGAERILELDPERLQVLRAFDVPRSFRGQTVLREKGPGIEGIAFVPDAGHPQGGVFAVVNQGNHRRAGDAPALLLVEIPLRVPCPVTIVDYFAIAVEDLSDVFCGDPSEPLYVISDANDLLLRVARDGRIVQQAALPGAEQEGFARDAAGCVYVAQDVGGVLKFGLVTAQAGAGRPTGRR